MKEEQESWVEAFGAPTSPKTAQIEGKDASQQRGGFQPTLNFYHQNARGTGSALKIELHPAHDATAGSVMFVLAGQKSLARREGDVVRQATFDWPSAVIFKVDFGELAKMIAVLRGHVEAVNEGKGFLHKSARGMVYIHFRQTTTPVEGFLLDVNRVRNTDEKTRLSFLFTADEALGLELALSASMRLVAFGARGF